MTSALATVIGLAIVAGILWYVRKAGADGAKATANSEALKDVVKANAPASPDDIKRVQQLYRRD